MADLVYPPVIGFVRSVFLALGLRFDLQGLDHVPAQGGAVVASNHVGYLDFTFVGLAFRPAKRLVRFMAKDAVFRHPVSGPLMRGMRHIPVDRDAGAASYAAAVDALRRGELVGVFPEATISRSFEVKACKTGAARMAAEAGVPLLPVVVWGSQRVMTKGRPRDLRASRGTLVSVTVGEPLQTTGDAVADTARLRSVLQSMLDDAIARYPVSEPEAWWRPLRLGGTAPSLEEADRLDAEESAGRRARRGAGGTEPDAG